MSTTINDPIVLFDAYIEVNSNVIAANGNKVGLNMQIEDLDATTFGQTAKVRRGGLFDGSLELSILNNFDAGEIDSIMFALLIARVPVTFKVRPTSAAKGVDNPEYSGKILLTKWGAIAGDVGKLAAVDVSWPSSELWTRATS